MNVLFEKIVPDAKMPERASNLAVGYDVYANRVLVGEVCQPLPFVLKPGQSVMIGTGLRMMIPWPWQCEVRPRSGLAKNHRITLANSPGTVDPDYRGELGILLCNEGSQNFTVEKDMRIAQLIFSKASIPNLEMVQILPATLRGNGGFGSTGLGLIQEGTAAYDGFVKQLDIFYMNIAVAASSLSTCVRGCPRGSDGKFLRDSKGRLVGQTRRFGCVIVKDNNVVSIGFNAQAPGQLICSEAGCMRDAEKIPSGTRIEFCRAIHAEEMALAKMLVSGVGTSTQGASIYVTSEPCLNCSRVIAGLGIESLIMLQGNYPLNGIQIIKDAGIAVRFLNKEDL